MPKRIMPQKFSVEKLHSLYELISLGVGVGYACQMLEISEEVFSGWRSLARELQNGLILEPLKQRANEDAVAFTNRVMRREKQIQALLTLEKDLENARFAPKLNALRALKEAGKNDYRAARTWLEMNYPSEYGNGDRIPDSDRFLELCKKAGVEPALIMSRVNDSLQRTIEEQARQKLEVLTTSTHTTDKWEEFFE